MVQNATQWRMVQTTGAIWLLHGRVTHAWNGQHWDQIREYRQRPIQIRVLENTVIVVTQMDTLMEPGVIRHIGGALRFVTSASQNPRALVSDMTCVLLFCANNCLDVCIIWTNDKSRQVRVSICISAILLHWSVCEIWMTITALARPY